MDLYSTGPFCGKRYLDCQAGSCVYDVCVMPRFHGGSCENNSGKILHYMLDTNYSHREIVSEMTEDLSIVGDFKSFLKYWGLGVLFFILVMTIYCYMSR